MSTSTSRHPRPLAPSLVPPLGGPVQRRRRVPTALWALLGAIALLVALAAGMVLVGQALVQDAVSFLSA